MIQVTEAGTILTNEHTQLMRWASLKVGIKLEMCSPSGMKLTRGPSCKVRACKFLGISTRTSAEKVLELIEAKIGAVKVASDAEEAVRNS